MIFSSIFETSLPFAQLAFPISEQALEAVTGNGNLRDDCASGVHSTNCPLGSAGSKHYFDSSLDFIVIEKIGRAVFSEVLVMVHCSNTDCLKTAPL